MVLSFFRGTVHTSRREMGEDGVICFEREEVREGVYRDIEPFLGLKG